MISEIGELLKYVYIKKNYEELMSDKPINKDLGIWKNFIFKLMICDKAFLQDTTSQNLCFTAFSVMGKIKSSEIIVNNTFYIHKSMIGDFVTFYGKSEIVINRNGRMTYPTVLICSPMGDFECYFKNLWKSVKDEYPNAKYVPFQLVNSPIQTLFPNMEFDERFNKSKVYELLFGYERDVRAKSILGDIQYSPENK